MNRFFLVLAFLFAASMAAFAGDDVKKLLVQLGDEDPDVRIAAREALMRDDGTGYEECKACLESTTDPEVRVHLGPIVKWLAVAHITPQLERIWRERAFIETRDGKAVGIERQTATLEVRDGRRVWVFRTRATVLPQAANDGSNAPALDLDSTSILCADPKMTFLSAETEISDGEFTTKERWIIDGSLLAFQLVEGPPRADTHLRDLEPLGASDETPLIPDSNLIEFLERAVVAGSQEIACRRFRSTGREFDRIARIEPVRLAPEAIRFRGEDCMCVHFRLPADAMELWISQKHGLLRAQVADSLIERTDEAALVASGLDAAPRRKALLDSLMKDVVSSNEALRKQAEEVLMGLPEAREACVAALGSNPGGGPRESLTRVSRWHDPGSCREQTLELRKERWFVIRDSALVCGVEHNSVASAGPEALEYRSEAYLGPRASDSALVKARISPNAWMMPFAASTMLGHLELKVSAEAADSPSFQVVLPPSTRGARVLRRFKAASFNFRHRAHLVPDFLVPEVIERASLLHLASLRMAVLNTLDDVGPAVHLLRVEFDGEETLTWQGAEVRTRRYRRTPDCDSTCGDTWWVSDTLGLLALKSDRFRVERVQKSAYEAAGFDQDLNRLAALDASCRDLLTGNDRQRARATVELLGQPAASPKLREGIASAPTPEARAAAQALIDWHDPSFKADALAMLWRSRTIHWKGGAATDVPDELTVRRDEDGAGWTATYTKDVRSEMKAECVIHMDASTLASTRIEMTFEPIGPDAKHRSGMPRSAVFRVFPEGCVIDAVMNDGSDASDWMEFDPSLDPPPCFGPTHLMAIERASAVRLNDFTVTDWNAVFNREPRTVQLEFAGEESLEVAGRKVVTRRYVTRGAEAGEEREYWVSDEAGIVRGREGDREVSVQANEEIKPK